MRLIDADALINKRRIISYTYPNGLMSEPGVLLKDIEKAPTIDAEPVKHGKWIPVTERLPEETGLYLVSLKTKGVELFEETHPDGFVYVSAYDAVIMHWGYGDKNVQAWMPLPKPYRREK